MKEKLKSYLKNSGLQVSKIEFDNQFLNRLKSIIEKETNSQNIEKLLNYKVPKLTPDGSCSISDELDENPYDLKQSLVDNGFNEENTYSLVGKVDRVVEFLHREIGSDWTGIYKKLDSKSGRALVKIAYRGTPSRAEFSLTEEFAKHSNNSTVGLRGKAVLVNSVRKHIESGQPYYECDNKVQSELCVPIFSDTKEIIGIIDLESFSENFFNDTKVLQAAIVCILLSESGYNLI